MKNSVLLKLGKYEEKKHYDNPSPSLIFADLIDRAEKLTLHNINICLTIHDYINNAGVAIRTNNILPNIIVPYHCHDYYECNYVFEGTILQLIGDEKYVMEAGDLLVMTPSVYHTYYALPGTKSINVLLRDEYLSQLSKSFEMRGEHTFLKRIMTCASFILFHCETPHYLDRYFLPLHEAEHHFANRPNLGETFKRALFDQIVADITLNTEQGLITPLYTNIRKADTLKELFDYMEENFASISRKTLAQKFGYSETQIARIIKKHTGNSYTTYITSMRIYTAMDLLKNTDKSVSEVAKAVGFDSVEHFCRLYKKHVGYAPLQHKKYMQDELKAAVGVPIETKTKKTIRNG